MAQLRLGEGLDQPPCCKRSSQDGWERILAQALAARPGALMFVMFEKVGGELVR